MWLVFWSALLIPSASAAFKYLQEGMTAPTVSGKDSRTGADVTSAPNEENKVVVVAFWATWSDRSVELLADLKSMVERFPDLPFKVIAVNVEGMAITSEAQRIAEQEITSLELPFPIIFDAELRSFYEFGVIAVPSTAILDSSGILRYAPSGYSLAVRDRIADTIEVLLGLKAPEPTEDHAPDYEPHPKSLRYYQLALRLYNERMFERALANLDIASREDSAFSAPYNLRGLILLEFDSLSAAAGEFAEAVRHDSNSVAAWAGWGRSLLRIGQLEEASHKLASALALDSSYTPALLDSALLLFEGQQPESALDMLLEARELNPRDPVIRFYLGRIYMAEGRLGEAANAFQTALEIVFPTP